MHERVGYYLTCDDAVCPEHAPAGFAEDDFSKWAGFRGWESPGVILDSDKFDSPTHCSVETCEALIPHGLTAEGYSEIAERVTRYLRGESGRREIQMAWWDQYGDDFSESELAGIAEEAGLERCPDCVTPGEIRGAIERA